MQNTKEHIVNLIKLVLTEEEHKESILQPFNKFLTNISPYIKNISRPWEGEPYNVYNVLTKDGGELGFSFEGNAFLDGQILYDLKNKYRTPMSNQVMKKTEEFHKKLGIIYGSTTSKETDWLTKNRNLNKLRANEIIIFKTFMNMINSKSGQ